PGPTGQYVAQARVFAKEDAIFQKPEKWYERGARDIPHDGEFIHEGDPALTVTVKDTSYNKALEKLRGQAANLYSDLLSATASSL
ncbi:hypothetical protein MNBD_NITROSPINAE02-867, partial [hydrothermal vent metagenome]